MRRGWAARQPVALALTAGLLVLPAAAPAEEGPRRRALLVAIDKYRPLAESLLPEAAATPDEAVVVSGPAKRVPVSRGTWTDLDGAVNDILALRELLIARFGFRPDDITVLTDADATRMAILAAIEEQLVNQGRPGDQALYAYAGHGSRVRNSLTDEPDGFDETLVPADSHRGVPDIRDKELNRLFNKALDKGVRLTVISDSCHSGSIARGLPRPEKTRYLPPDERDVKEAPDGAPWAEERGAVVLSAAQDHQLAGETSDEEGNPHGVFSLALLRTLQTVSPEESVQNIFLKVKALMQSEGRLQEPVLAGSPERRAQSLFENGPAVSARTRVAVLRKSTGRVTLQGGAAVGLREGCELRSVEARSEGPAPRLRVVELRGITVAQAEVIEGNVDAVSTGDLFEVDRWVAADAPLRVWWPSPAPDDHSLTTALERLSGLEKSESIEWVADPTETAPTHVLLWDEGRWWLSGGTETQALGPDPTTGDVVTRLRGFEGRPRLFVQVPPSAELACPAGARRSEPERWRPARARSRRGAVRARWPAQRRAA